MRPLINRRSRFFNPAALQRKLRCIATRVGVAPFDSGHLDQISTMVLIRNHRVFSILIDIHTEIAPNTS